MQVYEARALPDPIHRNLDRSYSLAMSHRGMGAVEKATPPFPGPLHLEWRQGLGGVQVLDWRGGVRLRRKVGVHLCKSVNLRTRHSRVRTGV